MSAVCDLTRARRFVTLPRMLRRSSVALGACLLLAPAAHGQTAASPGGVAAVGGAPQTSGPAAALSRDWKRLSYAGVTVVGNASAGDLRRAALQLEGFKQAMRQLLGPLDVSSPVPNVLVVFKDDAAMARFKPRDERGRTNRYVAGYFETTPDVNYMVMSTMWTDEQMLSVLFHEYTHYIVHRNMRRVPTWASEGVAEFFSTYRQADDGQVTVGTMPTMRVRALSSGRWFPVGKLLTREGTAEALRTDGDRYYAESWALVHYLLLNKARQGQLAAYLKSIQAGTPIESAFAGAFHATVDQMDKELRHYLQLFKLPLVSLPRQPVATDAGPVAAAPMREVDALQVQGDLLARAHAYDEAEGVLGRALAAAPDDLRSQVSMAAVRLGQERTSEAVALLRKAVERAPDDFSARYWLGVSLVAAEQYKEALATLAAAVGLNNASPDVWLSASIAAMAADDAGNADVAMEAVQRLDSNPSWFYTRALNAFAVGRYAFVGRDAEAYVREAGAGDDSAPYASLVGALAFGRLNEPAKAHQLMEQVKASVADTSWQAAVARYLDGEITASALLGRADGVGQQTEAHAYIGVRSATEGRRDEALEHLTWVQEKGSRTYVEYRLAVADLKRLKPAQR